MELAILGKSMDPRHCWDNILNQFGSISFLFRPKIYCCYFIFEFSYNKFVRKKYFYTLL